MTRTMAAALAGVACLAAAGCTNYLDVNTNPNAPQSVSANLYLPPMEHWMVTAPQYDGRFVGRYTQEWALSASTVLSTWDRMGYDPASDNGAEQWRDVYWSLGQNLVDMMNKARAQQRWDVLGVGYVMKAWGFQVLADLHGSIIIKEFPDPTRTTFDYDTQQYAYETVRALLDSAITNLKRTDGAVDPTYLGQGDHIYNGDRSKWLKLAYAIYAMNMNHYTDKPSQYKPDSVIALVNQSFQSNADDALLLYPGQTSNDDLNFYGPTRGNIGTYRQTKFAVGLMDGSVFGVVDPRLSRILAPAPDGQFRGVDPNIANYGGLPASQRPNNLWGYVGTVGQEPGRYLFTDKVHFPLATYAQLQFVKAEAAYRKGDLATALTAYKNGVSSSIDFVNARIAEDNQQETQISATEKASFLASPQIIPAASNLTLTQIMSQKYIAQYGWGHNELWMDMRRYHYTDKDPNTGAQVYPGFSIPQNLYVDNGGKPVYLIRPRYNSEYVWNQAGLSAIGALAPDYHTTIPWIFQP